MILRIWRTKIDPARLEAYRRFERERCLPMLHKQPGLLGVLFLRQAEDQAASITIWEDMGAVAALESSPSYQRTACELFEGNLLVGGNLAVMSGTHSGTWPGRKPRTVSEQRSHRSRRTLRLRCDKRLEFPWDPSPLRGTRFAAHGSSNRADQTPVVKATREPYPCLVVVNTVHKLRGGADGVGVGKGSA